MTAREFRDRLIRRLEKAPAPIPAASQFDLLRAYFELLHRWNTKINLTSLPLDRPSDETFDRLFVEPLAAARHFPAAALSWIDLGSGGGSPAIPLKIVLPANRLQMVESKARKTAFLREAIRTLNLVESFVLNDRFESIATEHPATAQVVTVRAVRPDSTMFAAVAQLLQMGGRLLLFQREARSPKMPGFEHLETAELIDAKPIHLAVYQRTFHVEQRR